MVGAAAPFPAAWGFVTRFGEMQILLPAALFAGCSLARRPGGAAPAARWMLGLALAVLLTTASKVAFIGWGLGSMTLDFTGVSGHAMFAAAVYPLLLPAFVPQAPPAARLAALAAGLALALLIAVSRVEVQAHSVSEVVAGTLLGAGVVALVWWGAPLPARLSPWLVPLALAWFAIVPAKMPPLPTHAMVTRLALTLSGRTQPCTRVNLHWPAHRGRSTA